MEEQFSDSPSILRTNYVRIPELSEPDTCPWEDIALTLNLESGFIPNLRGNIPEPKLPRSETPRPGVSDWVKDCREEDAISFFCNNCTDKGILNAISRRDISHFTDLAAIVRKYCAMESAWKTQTKFWDNLALTKPPVRTKRVHSHKSPDSITKKKNPTTGRGTILEGWLNRPCKIHSTADTIPTHSLRACWVLW